MTNRAPDWVRTSDPVIRRPARWCSIACRHDRESKHITFCFIIGIMYIIQTQLDGVYLGRVYVCLSMQM